MLTLPLPLRDVTANKPTSSSSLANTSQTLFIKQEESRNFPISQCRISPNTVRSLAVLSCGSPLVQREAGEKDKDEKFFLANRQNYCRLGKKYYVGVVFIFNKVNSEYLPLYEFQSL